MNKKELIIAGIAYCAVSGVKAVMDKAAEVAILAIIKSKLPL